ncbi:type I-E CRISPR-associated protein Cas6/Cse3/CasE [Frankia sp. AgKG'84/4]|uniref:type I-E CRISPR-associated protein Cas6/Cse3/CasE n=1 Tax=Frankia sp. AgKG'84/4 TaxID=573490 RepID=UPI00200D330A|nr:type I-E CRISPR-associated protein Cas6/Cse3/CasE [Frankia sp. AgKG'84/4]MCL9794019.1 type I-E CRISPR-associated protein Cas6/Cse3/CasE [Frankia sp. AgKG'84/4]
MSAVWLVRILPDLRRGDVRADLADAVALHKRVMQLLPDQIGPDARSLAGALFRLEEKRTGVEILVQTRLAPFVEALPAGYGQVATRDLTGLLDRLHTGRGVHYRLVANPTKRLGRTAKHPGKLAVLRGDEAESWWTTRAGRCGLELRSSTALPLDDITGPRRGRAQVRHALTRYDGVAVVTDPDALRAAILTGVGRGKAHGAGLLSIAPLGGTR